MLGGVKVTLFCFKEPSVNTKQKFESLYRLIDGERLLSVVLVVVRFSADKSLDFHDATFFSYKLIFLKYNKAQQSCAASLK